MTLRTFYILMGFVTAIPCAAFLVAFQPPKGGYLTKRGRALRSRASDVAMVQRLLAFAVMMQGVRLVVVHLVNIHRPIVYENWIDRGTGIATTAIGAAAACALIHFYLSSRKWES